MVVGEDQAERFTRELHQAYVKTRLHQIPGTTSQGTTTTIEDPALANWDSLAEDLRESTRQEADHLFIKLRALDCEIASANDTREAVTALGPSETEVLAQMEHRRWVAERLIAGWQVGSPKSVALRQNPRLVSWDQLSEADKAHDRELISIIPRLLASAGKKICRRTKTLTAAG